MKGTKENKNLGVTMDTFSAVAVNLINNKQYVHLQNYLLLIERFLESKHHIAKSSLCDSLIPALFRFLENHKEKDVVISHFPANLHRMYCEYACAKDFFIQNDFKEFIIYLN